MKKIESAFAAAKKLYDAGTPSLKACIAVAEACFDTIAEDGADLRPYGDYKGRYENVAYSVGVAGNRLSRPFRPDLFETDRNLFRRMGQDFTRDIISPYDYNRELSDRFIYTVMTAFCIAYDLWKPGSRKTPGTFFEVLIGSIYRHRSPDLVLGKHVAIEKTQTPDLDRIVIDLKEDNQLEDLSQDEVEEVLEGNAVSTDLVIYSRDNQRAAIIPLKITTRERVVQAFAHQRILESAYPGKFKSFLTCVSEVQRDEKTSAVKQICVPGTIALFQKHLAELSGMYYCDIPQRYDRSDFQALVPTKNISELFADVDIWLHG